MKGIVRTGTALPYWLSSPLVATEGVATRLLPRRMTHLTVASMRSAPHLNKRKRHLGAPVPESCCPGRAVAHELALGSFLLSYFTYVAVQSCAWFCVKQAR